MKRNITHAAMLLNVKQILFLVMVLEVSLVFDFFRSDVGEVL